RDLHRGRGAKGRIWRLPRRGRHQPALPMQNPRAGVCLSAGDRVYVERPYAGRYGRDHRLDGHRFWRDRPVNTHGDGPPVEQPASFEVTPENLEKVKGYMAKYPEGRQQSAVLPLLDLAQRQSGGWLPLAAMQCVAELLQMPRIRVYEVATFYTMFNLRPVGR